MSTNFSAYQDSKPVPKPTTSKLTFKNTPKYTVRQVQQALNRFKSTDPKIEEDGVWGPSTEYALCEFKSAKGFLPRPVIGPLTASLLWPKGMPSKKPGDTVMPPWLLEMGKYMYKHEVKHNSLLRRWLKSDGSTLGDPSKLPWCGDAMETAIKLTLPKEPFIGPLGKNPYWARNWVHLGHASELKLGVMVVIVRGKGGHIASAVGYDPKRKRIRIRGGNQSNQMSDTWVAENRLIGYKKGTNLLKKPIRGLRAPSTWRYPLPDIPIMNSSGQVISTNEA